MTTDEITINGYLNELYQQTEGNIDGQASMYEVGMAIGLDKSAAGSLAEELMVQGQVELKTLSGGIAITNEGLAFLGISAAPPKNISNNQRLSDGPVVNDSDLEAIGTIIPQIKSNISNQQLEYALLEEIVLDLKTIEVQLMSPKPKTAILKEIFRSMQKNLEGAENNDTTRTIKAFID